MLHGGSIRCQLNNRLSPILWINLKGVDLSAHEAAILVTCCVRYVKALLEAMALFSQQLHVSILLLHNTISGAATELAVLLCRE